MAVTEVEQLLIDYLATSKAEEVDQHLSFIAMDTEDQMLKMCRFLSDNPEASSKEILTKARKISKEN